MRKTWCPGKINKQRVSPGHPPASIALSKSRNEFLKIEVASRLRGHCRRPREIRKQGEKVGGAEGEPGCPISGERRQTYMLVPAQCDLF